MIDYTREDPDLYTSTEVERIVHDLRQKGYSVEQANGAWTLLYDGHVLWQDVSFDVLSSKWSEVTSL